MRTRAFIFFCVSSLGLLSCGVGPGFELWYGATTRWCGPIDGPVTTIMLSHDPIADPKSTANRQFPYLWVRFPATLLGPDATLVPGSWDVTYFQHPGVWYVIGPDTSQAAVSGTVVVTSVDSTEVVGTVDFQFPVRSLHIDFTASGPTRPDCVSDVTNGRLRGVD